VLVAGNNLLLPGSVVDVPAVVVAATDRNDHIASYSSGVGNVRWAVAAPGGEADTPSTDQGAGSCESATPQGILSTYFVPDSGQNTYACVAGTSMAAPHVSGALAVLLSAGLTPQQAIDRLLSTADDLGPTGRDNQYGSGRINLARAVSGLEATGSSGGVTVTDPSTTSTTATTATTEAPSTETTSTPVVSDTPPATDATPVTGPPPMVEPGITTPPVAVDSAAPTTDLPTPADDSLPALPLTLAVLLVVGATGGHAWRYLATASWARRTPDRISPPSGSDRT
jgi:subtilisin family serine protease